MKRSLLLRFLKGCAMGLALFIGLVAAMQLIPYGQASNPPVIAEPAWDSPRTRELAKKACFDCHSNETQWPWYAKVAPMSWVMRTHVENGRSVLNFSEWTRGYDLAHQAGPELMRREMPPRSYTMLHGELLTDAEKLELAQGLHKTLGGMRWE